MTLPLHDSVPPDPGADLNEPTAKPRRLWLHVLLFIATCASAVLSQPLLMALDRAGSWGGALHLLTTDVSLLTYGFLFGGTLMAILLAHEMGHYVTARRHGVDQSLPYFIPAPTLFGTLGAVILMRSQPRDRRSLLHVAVMGPYAGLRVALPAAAWGLHHSTPIFATHAEEPTWWFGSSLLFRWLEQLFSPNGSNVALHPVALAGWVGCFVTSLNLIPASQLDGGHVAYALFGRHQVRLSQLVLAGLLGIGLFMSATAGSGAGFVWIFWALLLFAFGIRHPPVRNEALPLTLGQKINGACALLLFALTFIPAPIRELAPGEPLPGAAPGAADDADEAPASGPAEEFRL